METEVHEIKRTPGKTLTALILGMLSLVYLINPGAGILELIPDNIPIIGNLDEAAAVVILLECMRYFGIDMLKWFRFLQDKKPKA